jgi:hypothetical protein
MFYALAGLRRDGNKDIKIPLCRPSAYRDFVTDLKAARAAAGKAPAKR